MQGDPQSAQLRNAMYNNILLVLVVTCCHCDIVFVIVIRQLVMQIFIFVIVIVHVPWVNVELEGLVILISVGQHRRVCGWYAGW